MFKTIEYTDGKYNGEVNSQGQRDGFGGLLTNDGRMYIGMWSNNENFMGEITLPNKTRKYVVMKARKVIDVQPIKYNEIPNKDMQYFYKYENVNNAMQKILVGVYIGEYSGNVRQGFCRLFLSDGAYGKTDWVNLFTRMAK